VPKIKSSLDLPLGPRSTGQSLTGWLYGELRSAILEGRLAPSTRLPATRDFAALHGLSRGTVVQVFERLLSEGYLCSRVGAGTWISDRVMAQPQSLPDAAPPDYIRRTISSYKRPKAFAGLGPLGPARPFRIGHIDLQEFPLKLWATLASHRARRISSWQLAEYDLRGYRPLREAVAHYLGSSRGVGCAADQIIIVSGIQQALDLLARLLLKPGAKVLMEDPGYFGARIAFETAGAHIVPVPIDSEGINIRARRKTERAALGAYVTPAHQFPLGTVMSLGRRMELLQWASNAGAFIIEDDYDSEYRFEGRPIPALMSMDRSSSVILVGSFSKLLFPSLRIGYIVAPPALADFVVSFRARTDFRSVHLEQAVMCDFIERGHLGQHLRRMREIYSERLATLFDAGHRYLRGAANILPIQSGLYTAAFLENGMSSNDAESAATAQGVETLSLDRYTLAASDPKGILLGFAGFPEPAIKDAIRKLAKALT
jgi:GntR family transcriptional regulator/MocR family aminotransferase